MTRIIHRNLFICFIIAFLFPISFSVSSQTPNDEPVRVEIGEKSMPTNGEIALQLIRRFQQYNPSPGNRNDQYDRAIHSPKSAIFHPSGKKFYVHSLEGFITVVYDAASLKKIKEIQHIFDEEDSTLFVNNEHTLFDYTYKSSRTNYNIFSGKPVESCLSHGGKYLWVTYYRRDYDLNAESPSALAIIDTETDSIVRVMPTGPLPKMIACSPDNRYIAVTHWGDNTVGIIDIQRDSAALFRYVAHCIIDQRARNDFGDNRTINRDAECGNCLRGTVFTPDGKLLLVGKMGGVGGIAVITTDSFRYRTTIQGMKRNLRHMLISHGKLILSTNSTGNVQYTSLHDLIESVFSGNDSIIHYRDWTSYYAGPGVRTIDVTSDGSYIFACVNNLSRIVVIRSSDMKLITTIRADSYPVGIAISPDNRLLVATSQGKSGKGGNSVMVYTITRQ